MVVGCAYWREKLLSVAAIQPALSLPLNLQVGAPQFKATPKMARANVVPPAQQPLEAMAQPVASAAAAVARGHLTDAVEAVAQKKKPVTGAYTPIKVGAGVASAVKPHAKMQASSKMADIKAAPVARRPRGPAAADLPPVQAIAKPLTAAGAAHKPVQAVAQPIQPVEQMAPAV